MRVARLRVALPAAMLVTGAALILAGWREDVRELAPAEVQQELAACAADGLDAQPVTSARTGRLVDIRCVPRNRLDRVDL